MIIRTLPGTTIELKPSEHSVRAMLSSVFLAGGLVLSQVSSLTGLPPHVLQNWIKRGFLSPPVNKKYSMHQFCRIAIINFLKDNLQIDNIIKMINAIGGNPQTDSDDLADDTELYIYFVETIVHSSLSLSEIDISVDEVLNNYKEPYPGAKSKLKVVIKVMGILYLCSELKKIAEVMTGELNL